MSNESLKKSLIQMRMELHRQEIRHELLLAAQPIEKLANARRYWYQAKPWISLAGIVTPVLLASLRIRSSVKKSGREKA